MKIRTTEELIACVAQYPWWRSLNVDGYEGEILDVPELLDLEEVVLVNCPSLTVVNWQPVTTSYGLKKPHRLLVDNCPKLAQSQNDCEVRFMAARAAKSSLPAKIENFAWLFLAVVVVSLILAAVTHGLGALISAFGAWKAIALIVVVLCLLSPWRLLFWIRPL